MLASALVNMCRSGGRLIEHLLGLAGMVAILLLSVALNGCSGTEIGSAAATMDALRDPMLDMAAAAERAEPGDLRSSVADVLIVYLTGLGAW